MAKTKAMINAIPDVEVIKAEVLKYHHLAKAALATVVNLPHKENGIPVVAGDLNEMVQIARMYVAVRDDLVDFLPHRSPEVYAWLKSLGINPNIKGLLPWDE